MYDSFLSSLIAHLADVSPTVVSPDHTVEVAIIITVGTVITGVLALVVSGIQRERSPYSTVEASDHEEREAIAHDSLVAVMVADLNKDKDEMEARLEQMRRTYMKLRTGVWKLGKNPDELIKEQADDGN